MGDYMTTLSESYKPCITLSGGGEDMNCYPIFVHSPKNFF